MFRNTLIGSLGFEDKQACIHTSVYVIRPVLHTPQQLSDWVTLSVWLIDSQISQL